MIRNARLTDVSRIAEILIFAKRTAYRSIFQNDMVSFNDLQVLRLAIELQEEGALDNVVVYDDGIVKGMMNRGKSSDADYENSIQIFEFYIEPFFQKQGIGSAMLKSFIAEAQDRKYAHGLLWVLEKNHRARTLYEKFGFCFDGCRKLQVGTEENIIRYAKRFVLAKPLDGQAFVK